MSGAITGLNHFLYGEPFYGDEFEYDFETFSLPSSESDLSEAPVGSAVSGNDSTPPPSSTRRGFHAYWASPLSSEFRAHLYRLYELWRTRGSVRCPVRKDIALIDYKRELKKFKNAYYDLVVTFGGEVPALSTFIIWGEIYNSI